MINLCALVYQIASALVHEKRGSNVHKGALNFLSTAIPMLLGLLGYVLENDSDTVDNAQLNVARHAFSCEMR
jgi:hypothetical protein